MSAFPDETSGVTSVTWHRRHGSGISFTSAGHAHLLYRLTQNGLGFYFLAALR